MSQVEELPVVNNEEIKLGKVSKPLSSDAAQKGWSRRLWLFIFGIGLLVLVTTILILHFIVDISFSSQLSVFNYLYDWNFLIYILVGFLAQMVDGALGMAYGVTSTSFLMSFGVSPAAASAGVHVSKVFTSGVSGWSHYQFGNVNKKLFKKLILPGMIGAAAGALLLTVVKGKLLKPFVSAYLVVMGVVIIRKAFKKIKKKQKTKNLDILAFVGGFVDSIGGGGWGPVVTSTLIGKGRSPKYTIGSVNLAEFFVALASAFTFSIMMEMGNWLVVAGLIIGGVIAAPLAALVIGKVKPKYLMIVVGLLIIGLSIRTIIMTLMGQ